MQENKRLKYRTVEHYEELIKLNIIRHFSRFAVIKNIFHLKKHNFWIDRLTESYIHFEANSKGFDCVDYKMKWTTYLAVMANQSIHKN